MPYTEVIERVDPVVAAGRELTVDDFLRAVRPRLLGTLALQHDYHVAEELTQETLATVYARWSEVSRARSPQAWAFAVAFNLARSALRRRHAERRSLSRMDSQEVAYSTGLDRADVLAVRQAIRRLPRRQRAALVLRYYADLSIAEIAEALDCSQGTVKSQLHDAIAALRARGSLAPEGDGRP